MDLVFCRGNCSDSRCSLAFMSFANIQYLFLRHFYFMSLSHLCIQGQISDSPHYWEGAITI